jgi:BirA family biotin operon repressor/biotin-[acetyl-CoA-carboxylase] ligase
MPLANLIRLESAGSTNEYASHLLQNSAAAEFTVIWALGQYSGRGTGGSSWESEPGKNLTFSMVLHPYFLDLSNQFILTRIIALGVHDFISSQVTNETVTIKWPNDIYIGNRKVAGILTENSVMDGKFRHSVVGIGINVNQLIFPSEIPNPVSLKGITGKGYNLEDSLEKVCSAVISRYQKLSHDPSEVSADEYISKLYRFNDFAKYRFRNQVISARITGVDEAGWLQLEVSDGEKISCDLKEIVFLQE